MTNYYSTTQQNSTSPPGADELVDERWDGNLGFYSTSNNAQNQPQETTLIKDHQLDTLFQSKHISRQVKFYYMNDILISCINHEYLVGFTSYN
jgi:hypothetical protein